MSLMSLLSDSFCASSIALTEIYCMALTEIYCMGIIEIYIIHSYFSDIYVRAFASVTPMGCMETLGPIITHSMFPSHLHCGKASGTSPAGMQDPAEARAPRSGLAACHTLSLEVHPTRPMASPGLVS